MLAYSYISAEEDKVRNLLPDGLYPFTVKEIQQKPNKNGGQQLIVTLSVGDSTGLEHTITDWIQLEIEQMAWKFRHFASSCGLIDLYDAKQLKAENFNRKNGVVKIGVNEYEKDGEMKKGNKVLDYLISGNASPSKLKPLPDKKSDFINDNIPF